jgi:ribose transport system permease protein
MTVQEPKVAPPVGTPPAGGGAPLGAKPTMTPALHHPIRGWLSPTNIGALYVLIAICIIFSILAPSTFPTVATVKQVLDNNAITALAALCIIIPLSAATFDLSFAYTMSLSGVTAAHLVVSNHMNVWLAMVLAIGVALVIGLINGFVIVVMHVDSFIGTLGTGFLVQAFITLVTGDNPIVSTQLNGAFTTLSQGTIGGFVYAVYWALGLAILLWVFMEYSATGRRLYATGFNIEAARLAGVRVDRLRFGALMASAGLAGFAGVMLASSLSSGGPTAGTSYLLPAFAAAFVGAIQFKRDRFNSWGTIVAVVMLGTGGVGLGLVSSAAWPADMFTGTVLVVALAATGLQQRNLLRGRGGAIGSLLRRRKPAAAG